MYVNKREQRVLNNKIWISNGCWHSDDDIIKAIEKSEIFPLLDENKSESKMTGKEFVEKWRGIIKDVEINNLRESK